jgi:hypothetical protein
MLVSETEVEGLPAGRLTHHRRARPRSLGGRGSWILILLLAVWTTLKRWQR